MINLATQETCFAEVIIGSIASWAKRILFIARPWESVSLSLWRVDERKDTNSHCKHLLHFLMIPVHLPTCMFGSGSSGCTPRRGYFRQPMWPNPPHIAALGLLNTVYEGVPWQYSRWCFEMLYRLVYCEIKWKWGIGIHTFLTLPACKRD
jgi:hypothetical protein